MPGRLAGQLVDGGDPVSDEPVFVVDTGPADESNWSIVATDRSAADGSWSVTVPNTDPKRYHAVAEFEESGTLKNALSKPFLTSQPFAQANAVSVGFDVLSPAVSVGSAIPDSVVDDFERDNLNPYDQTGNWATTQNNVIEGDHALEVATDSGASWGEDALISDSGLDSYPQKGDVIAALLRSTGDNRVGFTFGAAGTGSNIDYYAPTISSQNDFRIGKVSNNSFSNIETTTQTIADGEWYDLEVEWHDGSGDKPDNEIVARLFEVDEIALERDGAAIAEIQTNDPDFAANTGVGWHELTGNADGTMGDLYRVMGHVSTYDNPGGIII